MRPATRISPQPHHLDDSKQVLPLRQVRHPVEPAPALFADRRRVPPPHRHGQVGGHVLVHLGLDVRLELAGDAAAELDPRGARGVVGFQLGHGTDQTSGFDGAHGEADQVACRVEAGVVVAGGGVEPEEDGVARFE